MLRIMMLNYNETNYYLCAGEPNGKMEHLNGVWDLNLAT
jgi:hypothetical protein